MASTFKTWLFAGVAAVAFLVAGLVHGYWTDRWAQSGETHEAAARLDGIARTLGEWIGEDVEVKPGQGVAGSLTRRYTSRVRGVTVIMSLVCGRPGPVATHTPEVCYGASGYTVADKNMARLDVVQPTAQFWTSDAVRTKVTDETRLRLYWAWNGGGGWTASADARQEFPRHRHPVLHKLYVLRDLSGPAEARTRDEPCEAFLRVLLPELQAKLYGPGPGS
jgi:hypothetical protein